VALSGLAQGAAGLASGAQGLADSYQQFKQGDITGGLVSAGGALLSLRGGYSGLKSATALAGRYAPCQQRRLYPWTKDQSTCFTARMALKLVGGGSKPIAEFRPGDRVLTRSEFDPDGPPAEGVVVELHTFSSPVLNVHVEGRVIETTPEHPFWVRGTGWRCAVELRAGDEFSTSDGRWLVCQGVADSGRVEAVYNVGVAGEHTYFVTGDGWDFDVWAHNYGGSAKGANYAQRDYSKTFSKEGRKFYSELAGRKINTIDDLTSAIKAGHISPADIPVEIIRRPTGTLILNTRTGQSLFRNRG
jgi:hypothetical protein